MKSWIALVAVIGVTAAAPAAHAETQNFVVSWFAQATNSNDKDCSRGVHPEIEKVWLRYAQRLGVNPTQVAAWQKKLLSGEDDRELMEFVGMRGRVDGKPVNPYAHPAAVVDIGLPGLDSKYGYGFNLDGKSDTRDGFEDPETKETGVDHQLYRALGCARAFRGSLEGRPTYWAWAWGQLKDSQPAWLLSVTGEDLSKDGPVTIELKRAIEHLRSTNSDGQPQRDVSYRIDPDPRSQNTFRGEIRNGVVQVVEHGQLRLLQNPLVAPELNLSKFHLRLKVKANGTSEGFMGGYQPWHSIYWGFAATGVGGEQQVVGDIPALYQLMRRYADADPDPRTGQNTRISATYYFEAVPVFVRPAMAGQRLVTR